MAESIPEDIIVDILLRLPAKSLVRFKGVCKRWRSLISDPGFAKSHLQRLEAGDLIPSQKIIICGRNHPLETVDYEALGGGEGRVVVPHAIEFLGKPCIVGSCGGLICLIGFRNFVIYNPTTREYIELPGPELVNQAELFYRFGYEYQAELFYGFGYESFCGFGYDSQSDDYKIVAADVSSDENWKVQIFSLKSGSWRRIQVQFQEWKVELSDQGVYWKGAFHWHAYVWTIDDLRKDVIMSFDLSEEKFHQVFPVPEVDEEIDFLGLGIHGANLFIHHSTDYFIEAWLIDEYSRGALWTKFFRVDCSPFINWNNTPIPRKPIAYTRSGKIVFHMDMNLMILFNPEDNSRKDYPIEEDSGYAMYLETLVSPYLRGEPSRI